jgi:hypothetical protein
MTAILLLISALVLFVSAGFVLWMRAAVAAEHRHDWHLFVDIAATGRRATARGPEVS